VANARRDGLHKLTTRLTATFDTIVLEDLVVFWMLRNRRLTRQIAGVGWAEFRRQVDYKTRWRGGRVVVADRWFASSKTCSGCGAVKAKLRLSDPSCGATVNEPDGNSCQSRIARAAGTATGRPGPDGPGQRRHRKVPAA